MNRILLLCLLFFTVDLAAQDIAYGVEVGLNFNKFNGPAETDAQGAALETFKNTTGFHVGAGLRFKFLDRFGLNTQLQFSQKGGKVIFDGQALQVFAAESGQKVLTSGNRRTVIAVTNSYIDIPVMGYFKPNSKLELFAGANVGFLVGSTGYGEFIYNGTGSIDGAPIEFIAELDHNYNKDKGRSETDLAEFEKLITFETNNQTVTFPKAVGAYYIDFDTKDGNYYNLFDVGLIGGVSFYFNGSLYLGFRANYGLLDATNNNYDISHTEVNNLVPVARADKDSNLSLQASLGFSF